MIFSRMIDVKYLAVVMVHNFFLLNLKLKIENPLQANTQKYTVISLIHIF